MMTIKAMTSVVALVACSQAPLRAGQGFDIDKTKDDVVIFPPRRVGPAVTGAPYSAELVIEERNGSINSPTVRALVYRNSEGKTRVDGLAGHGNIAEIADPSRGASDILDLQNHVAHRMFLEPLVFIRTGAGLRQSTERFLLMSAGISLHSLGPSARGENIGAAIIDDIPVEGSEEKRTWPSQATVSFESWYAPSLKITILFRILDSHNGETTIKLTNIKPGEPPPALFEIPAAYRLAEEKSAFTIAR